MSKDIIVLTPNGRRQKIHCTPDTSFLQVLEDVCQKQGFQASDYDLKHHNHVLDLSSTIRFSNVPNKAMLEMVKANTKRLESNVTIGLQLEDGERRTAEFPPTTLLYDIVNSLAHKELCNLQSPAIMYMRQEVVGEAALREKSLRQLGLTQGRAILRLFNKNEEASQANVSTVYRVPIADPKTVQFKSVTDIDESRPVEAKTKEVAEVCKPSNVNQNNNPDLITKFKEIIKQNHVTLPPINERVNEVAIDESTSQPQTLPSELYEPDQMELDSQSSNVGPQTSENFERRLKIEEEVTFIGTRKAIAFIQPDSIEEEIEDLPDDFYDLTVEEVRKLYHDLQQERISLENTPLLPSAKRDEFQQQESESKRCFYNNAVVRVQFPDHIILQGIFSPTDTIGDINNFIKEHLRNPNREFHVFTTPLKETFNPKMTLSDVKFVPCVHMHFRWLEEDKSKEPCLKNDIYNKITKFDAASILASKYRAPSRRKCENSANKSFRTNPVASTSQSSKLPKWFKK